MDLTPTVAAILQTRHLFIISFLILSLVFPANAESQAPEIKLGNNGFLVVTAAQDTASGYQWIDGPGPQHRSLIWASGILSIPFDYPVEGFGAFDLAFPCTGEFGGVGKAGRLLMVDGQYNIKDPILLTDGTVYFFAEKGLLEIVATRIRYFPPETKDAIEDPRASFLLLGGLLILIAVLVRRSRKIIKKRANLS